MTHHTRHPDDLCPNCNRGPAWNRCWNPQPDGREGCGWTVSKDMGGRLDSDGVSQGGLDNGAVGRVGEGEEGSAGCVSLVLPWWCLASSNLRHAAKGGKAHDPKYTEARDNAAFLFRSQFKRPPINTPVKVSATYYPPDNVGDRHNYQKQLFDSLQLGKVVKSDKLIIAWAGNVLPPDPEPRCEVTITVLDMETGEAA